MSERDLLGFVLEEEESEFDVVRAGRVRRWDWSVAATW